MNQRKIPWIFVCVTLFLGLSAAVFFWITFFYAETTPDPDKIASVAWFICLGLFAAAITSAVVTLLKLDSAS